MGAWIPAAIGAAGSIVGGLISSNSASKASSKSSNAADAAAQAQLAQYNQTRTDLAPYRAVGTQALNVLAATYGYAPYDASTAPNEDPYQTTDPTNLVDTGQVSDGGRKIFVDKTTGYGYIIPKTGGPIPTGSKISGWPMTSKAATAMGAVSNKAGTNLLASNPTYSYFTASPDYNFRLDQGISALDRSAASRGLVRSGAQAKGVLNYGSNLAAGEYGNWFNRQADLAGIGQTATNQTGTFGANAVSNASNAYQNAADTRASGYLAQGNIWGGIAGGIGNSFANAYSNNPYSYNPNNLTAGGVNMTDPYNPQITGGG